MTRYIFVNNFKFIEPVMSLDSRDKQKQGRAAQSPPPGRSRKYGAHEHISNMVVVPHFVRRVVYTSNFACVKTFFFVT